MVSIAGLQDFRGEGVPGDIGVFQSTASIIVYQLTFSGVTYNVAQRMGVRGWVLVSQGTVALTVIQNALNALTVGRTYKEKIVLKGIFTLSGPLIISSFTILDIYGELICSGDTRAIEIIGTAMIPKNYIEIRHGTITGLYAGSSDYGIYLRYANMIKLDGILLQGFNVGLQVEKCVLDDVNHCTISDNNIYDIQLSEGNAFNFEACNITLAVNAGGFAVILRDYSGGNSFYDCVIEGNGGGGIEILDSHDNLFSRCWFEKNFSDAVYIAEAPGTAIQYKGRNLFHKCSFDSDDTNLRRRQVFLETSYEDKFIDCAFLNGSGWNYSQAALVLLAGAFDTQIERCSVKPQAGVLPFIIDGGTRTRIINNPDYNPHGNVATPYSVAAGQLTDSAAAQAFPTSATNYTVSGSPKLVTIYGGTITSVSIDGVATGQAGAGSFAAYRLEPGQILNVVWTGQPSSVVYAC